MFCSCREPTEETDGRARYLRFHPRVRKLLRVREPRFRLKQRVGHLVESCADARDKTHASDDHSALGHVNVRRAARAIAAQPRRAYS